MAVVALDAHEREEIRVGLEAEESFRAIARRLGREPSTVMREVKRNGGRSHYRAAKAQRRAERLASRRCPTKFERHEALADHVEARLVAKDSPTTIAIELARAGGVNGVTTSPESIYQAIYANGRQGLAPGLGKHLHRRRHRRRRRRAVGTPQKASPLGTFAPIASRPAAADARSEVGHFEGDLIIGRANKSAIVTLVERVTRYSLYGDLPGGHDATSVLACLIELLERVPQTLRKSLTWDRGTELARHVDLAGAVDIDVYFADSHSPWQRGANENGNGILRRYVGKGTDLSVYDQSDLDQIANRINTMPRRLFQWESAQDRYHAATVALTV